MIMLAWFMRWRMVFATVGAILPALAVAGVTGYASWGHIKHVGETVQEPSAALLPVAVDGMMLAGAFFALVDRLRGYEPRGWAVVCIWLGSVMTLTFNILSATTRGWAAMAISAVYAITFLATVEAAFHPSRIMLGASSRAIKRAAKLARKVERARRGMPPVSSAVEPVAVPVAAVPTPEAPPVTQAVEPSDAPVDEDAEAVDVESVSRARRAPNGTTEHPRPKRNRRKPSGRGYPGTDDREIETAVAVETEPEPDAMGEGAVDVAASVPAEPVSV